jgi:transposase
MPPKRHRKEALTDDQEKYKWREKSERFFNTLKQFRGIATRYDKLGHILLAFIHLVASDLIVK